MCARLARCTHAPWLCWHAQLLANSAWSSCILCLAGAVRHWRGQHAGALPPPRQPGALSRAGHRSCMLCLLRADAAASLMFKLGPNSEGSVWPWSPDQCESLLQGMILGEVEFTVHKDASGAYCAEGTPGATTIRCGRGAARPVLVVGSVVCALLHQQGAWRASSAACHSCWLIRADRVLMHSPFHPPSGYLAG